MVADALKIADGVQQGVHALAVGVAQLPAGKLDKVGAQGVFIAVHLALLVPHLLGKGIVPLVGQAHGLHDAHAGQLGHFAGGTAGTLHGHGRGVQQTLIQQGKALFFRGRMLNAECTTAMPHASMVVFTKGKWHTAFRP